MVGTYKFHFLIVLFALYHVVFSARACVNFLRYVGVVLVSCWAEVVTVAKDFFVRVAESERFTLSFPGVTSYL